MFRKWPFFQRMLSWTKPFAPADRRSQQYERYDWNSLLADEEELRGVQAEHMDGTSYFPSRQEMEAGLTAFAEDAGIQVRYGCRWESTGTAGESFVLGTSDGEYRAGVLVFAVGVAQPWRPDSPGLGAVPHYAEMKDAGSYAGKDVFIVGKKNSGFEIANGLLPWARTITLASPSQARTSVETRSLVGVRARYVQPIEDNALGGGVWVVNASIDAIERDGGGYRVRTHYSDGSGSKDFTADEVIAATGFQAPLLDLPKLGVSTFGQSVLPAQTAFWESATVNGVYFAGTLSQGAAGLKKHGVPSNSGAVHGHRYNARVLARHIAEAEFKIPVPGLPLNAATVNDRLLDELSGRPGYGADIFHQRSYLARVIVIDSDRGVYDDGIQPLTHFLDDKDGPDAVAATLEANTSGVIYPAIYVRRNGSVADDDVLDPDVLLDFRGREQQKKLAHCLAPLLRTGVK
jgi:thioredoxin reductase